LTSWSRTCGCIGSFVLQSSVTPSQTEKYLRRAFLRIVCFFTLSVRIQGVSRRVNTSLVRRLLFCRGPAHQQGQGRQQQHAGLQPWALRPATPTYTRLAAFACWSSGKAFTIRSNLHSVRGANVLPFRPANSLAKQQFLQGFKFHSGYHHKNVLTHMHSGGYHVGSNFLLPLQLTIRAVLLLLEASPKTTCSSTSL
jgi:hypothetical protein